MTSTKTPEQRQSRAMDERVRARVAALEEADRLRRLAADTRAAADVVQQQADLRWAREGLCDVLGAQAAALRAEADRLDGLADRTA